MGCARYILTACLRHAIGWCVRFSATGRLLVPPFHSSNVLSRLRSFTILLSTQYHLRIFGTILCIQHRRLCGLTFLVSVV